MICNLFRSSTRCINRKGCKKSAFLKISSKVCAVFPVAQVEAGGTRRSRSGAVPTKLVRLFLYKSVLAKLSRLLIFSNCSPLLRSRLHRTRGIYSSHLALRDPPLPIDSKPEWFELFRLIMSVFFLTLKI